MAPTIAASRAERCSAPSTRAWRGSAPSASTSSSATSPTRRLRSRRRSARSTTSAARARFEWVQSGYSLLDRSAEAEVLPLCADQGLGFSPFSPLSGGWLTGKYRRDQAPPAGSRMTLRSEPYEHLQRPEVFDALEMLEATAEARGVDMPTLALAWLLAHPLVNPIVVGPRRAGHLRPALAALELQLGAAERDEISALFPISLGAAS